jgi:sugar/nucleoside kinase (ribokinase family)
LSERAAKRWDVLGVGQCAVDELARVDAAPPAGEKARMWERAASPGGQIATATLACARLGHRAALISSTGDDAAAEVALAPLRAAGVDVARVQRVPGARTQSAWIWVDARGERTVLWERDARLALPADAVARGDIAAARVVILDAGDLALALRVAELARGAGVPCVLDADTSASGLEALLARTSHPVISHALARALFGSAQNAVRVLAEAGAQLPVVTCGSDGAIAWLDGAAVHSPAFAIAPVDTTGAGDAFHAGVAHALLCGLAGAELLRTAHAVAACACLARGAQGGLPDAARLREFLATTPLRPQR